MVALLVERLDRLRRRPVLRLLAARRDVDRVLAREELDPRLRAALLDSQTVLEFARQRLDLDPDGRYGSYVDLNREFVVWNLVVTPVDSVQCRQSGLMPGLLNRTEAFMQAHIRKAPQRSVKKDRTVRLIE